MTRQAAAYRDRRVPLTGDAAHVHHPIGGQGLNTGVQDAALRDIMSELLRMDEPRRRFAAMMSGLDIHYDLGDGRPMLGRRMPDLDLIVDDCPARAFTLLYTGQTRNPLVSGSFRCGRGSRAVRRIGPARRLRHVGFDGDDAGLADALTRWFGLPLR